MDSVIKVLIAPVLLLGSTVVPAGGAAEQPVTPAVSLPSSFELGRRFQQCQDRFTPAQRKSFDTLPKERQLNILDQVCREDAIGKRLKRDIRARYEACRDQFTAAQQVKFRGLAIDRQYEVIEQVCRNPAEMSQLIVLKPDNQANLSRKDIDYIETTVASIIMRAKLPVVAFDGHPKKRKCDRECQFDRAKKAGATHAVTGTIRTFVGSYIVTFELISLSSRRSLAAIESGVLEGAAQLLAGVKTSASELLDKANLSRIPVDQRTRPAQAPNPYARAASAKTASKPPNATKITQKK